MKIGVKDLNFRIILKATRCEFALALHIHIHGFGAVAVYFKNNALEIKDYLGNVFFNTGDGGELMKDPIDFNRCNCISGE